MKIYKLDTASDFEKLNLCLAIGNFDGIHKGHQEIINKIKEIASNNNLLSSIMSFNPHPCSFLFFYILLLFSIQLVSHDNPIQVHKLSLYLPFVVFAQ